MIRSSNSSSSLCNVVDVSAELETVEVHASLNAFIASIPMIVLSIIIAFVGQYSWRIKDMWENGFSCNVEGASLHNSVAAAKKLHSLRFKDIAVYVAMPEDEVERKRHALRGKALARHNTTHIISKDQTTAHKLIKKIKRNIGAKTSDDFELPPSFLVPTKINKSSDAAQRVVNLHNGRVKGEWCVLKDCSGTINSGEVVGILGPSGCGKTTLLSTLTGSAFDLGSKSVVKGDVLVDGEKRKAHQVAYVPQSDHLIPTLTVRETIKYSALLRLPKAMTANEINHRVEAVLIELGIQHISDSQVGGSGKIRGISGGERRRVTIGMELVTDPSIIVLDEPTSGLDSHTAMMLMRTLRQVALGGRMVVASLHQPSKDMYFSLDKILLMGHGRILYLGKPEEADAYMEEAGVSTPPGAATAEHLLNVASNPESVISMFELRQQKRKFEVKNIAVGSPTRRLPLGPFVEQDRESPTDIDSAQTSIIQLAEEMEKEQTTEEIVFPGLERQLSVMFWRTLVDIVRNPTLLALHVGISTFTGIITGAIFYELTDDSIGVQNRMGGTFFALAFLAFTSLTTVDLLMNERSVVMREVRSRYYRPVSYLLSKLALDGMLLRVVPAILYWLPFYYMAGFNISSASAASYLFVLITFNLAVGALSMVITIMCSTAGQSSFIMNFILLFSLAFTGFLVNVNSIPVVIRWIHYLSVFYYAFEGILTTQLNGEEYVFVYYPKVRFIHLIPFMHWICSVVDDTPMLTVVSMFTLASAAWQRPSQNIRDSRRIIFEQFRF